MVILIFFVVIYVQFDVHIQILHLLVMYHLIEFVRYCYYVGNGTKQIKYNILLFDVFVLPNIRLPVKNK